jgi:hypothetical protein
MRVAIVTPNCGLETQSLSVWLSLRADHGSGGRYVGQAQAMPQPHPIEHNVSPEAGSGIG